MASLSDVVEELRAQRKDTEKLVSNQEVLNKAIQTFIAGQSSADRLQELEDKAESRRAPSPTAFQQGQQAGEGFNINFGWLLNPMGLLSPLLVGVAGVAAAFAGLRGWEASALRNIGSLGDTLSTLFRPIGDIADRLSTRFLTFVDDMVRGTLTRFGINPETGRMARDTLGRFTGREAKSTADMISEAMNALRGRVFSMFGLGPAGGLADDALRAADDAPGVISRVTSAFGRIMTPFRAIYEGIESFIAGPGARLFGFLDGVLGISRIGSAAAGLAGAIGKILWPIGILMSIFDGVSAYQNEEGSQYDRITAGISATIGDFLGAPLDLLKSLAAWVISKFGFDETADAIRSFSFEETIGNLLNGIFDFVGASVEWVKTLFTDPAAALSQLWNSIYSEGGLIDILFTPVRLAIDWITKKMGWREEDAPTFSFGALIQEGIDGVITLFKSAYEMLPPFSFSELVQQGIDNVMTMFRNAFNALPSWEDITSAIISALPSWMVPDSMKTPEMRIREREQAIAEEQDRISRSEAGENVYFGRESVGREKSLAEIERLTAEAEALRAGLSISRPEPQGFDEFSGLDNSTTATTAESILSSQTGAALRTSEVVDAVRENNQPIVVPVPVPVPQPAPAPSGNENGGGAFLLPAAPTIDILDAVPSYDARMYQGL